MASGSRDERPREKETKRSWFVVALVTIVMFFEIGIIKAFSVLLPDLKEQFSTSTWVVGSTIAIISAWGYLLGLSADSLVKVMSPRCCSILCGLISSIGLAVCACATNPYILLVGQILTGFLLLQETIVIGIVPDYLDRHYATAVSIYTCGTGFGIIFMPILTQMCLDTYGWRGSLWLLSGLNLHSIPLSALIKPPKEQGIKRRFRGCIGKQTSIPKHSIDVDISTGYKKGMLSLLTKMPFVARVLIPGVVIGYVIIGWMIYIVSFALSNGASPRESSIVAACGGIGLTLIRTILPCVHMRKLMTYKQLMYASSALMSISLILHILYVSFMQMCIISVLFGIGLGVVGAEMYIAANDVAEKDEQMLAVAWLHLAFGFSSILSGVITGWFYDVTSSFQLSFIILAAVSSLIIVSYGIEDIWIIVIKMRMKRSRLENDEKESVSLQDV